MPSSPTPRPPGAAARSQASLARAPSSPVNHWTSTAANPGAGKSAIRSGAPTVTRTGRPASPPSPAATPPRAGPVLPCAATEPSCASAASHRLLSSSASQSPPARNRTTLIASPPVPPVTPAPPTPPRRPSRPLWVRDQSPRDGSRTQTPRSDPPCPSPPHRTAGSRGRPTRRHAPRAHFGARSVAEQRFPHPKPEVRPGRPVGTAPEPAGGTLGTESVATRRKPCPEPAFPPVRGRRGHAEPFREAPAAVRRAAVSVRHRSIASLLMSS